MARTKAQEAEDELAKLLGWTRIRINPFGGSDKGIINGVQCGIPRWCHNDACAFQLMVDYGIGLDTSDEATLCADGYLEDYDSHQDRLAATRYTIVQAVIRKLRKRNDQGYKPSPYSPSNA